MLKFMCHNDGKDGDREKQVLTARIKIHFTGFARLSATNSVLDWVMNEHAVWISRGVWGEGISLAFRSLRGKSSSFRLASSFIRLFCCSSSRLCISAILYSISLLAALNGESIIQFSFVMSLQPRSPIFESIQTSNHHKHNINLSFFSSFFSLIWIHAFRYAISPSFSSFFVILSKNFSKSCERFCIFLPDDVFSFTQWQRRHVICCRHFFHFSADSVLIYSGHASVWKCECVSANVPFELCDSRT